MRNKNTEKLRILLVYPNIPLMLVPPLSIAVFTWILRKEGYCVDLFDTTHYRENELASPQNRVKFLQARDIFSDKNLELCSAESMKKDFAEKIRAFKPGLILYSFTEDALRRTLELLRVSNEFHIPTVLGGVLATADPEWLISFPEISMIGVGEGEETVKTIASRIEKKEPLTDVPNLWIKMPDGSIQKNACGDYVNLDSYSTDFSLFEEGRLERPMGGKIHRCLPIETYRGCPYICTFCNSPMHNRLAKAHNRVFLRRRSIPSIRQEIEHLRNEYGINLLYFVDDSFLARPRKEIDDFIDMYREFKIPFWFNTRPENCSLDILQKLKAVGLFRVSFGIESGNETFRKKHLKRYLSNKELLGYFDIINESGISYSINYILGFPHETRSIVFDTIRFAKLIKGYDAITVSIFTPYRGTALRSEAIQNGWLDEKQLTVHTTASSILQMPQLTSMQIDGLIRTFPLYVEFDESHWPDLERIERFDPGSDELFEQYARIYREKHWKESS